jgi:hypothetical protein
MRIFEIANAEEQMALWKLISGSVWTAIEQQVQQQQRERAAQAKQAAKGKGKRKRIATPASITLPPPPQRPSAQQQPANATAVKATQSAADDVGNVALTPSTAPTSANDASDIADFDIKAADSQQSKNRQKSQKMGVLSNKGS